MNGSATATYFERMAYIEEKFYEVWKDLSLDDTMDEVERSKLAVWDYPVSDKYTKIWQTMKEAGLPNTFEEALARVRTSKSSSEGYAFLGDATDIKYQTLVNCDLLMVGDEFSRKPYAVAVQQGSPLKDQLNDAILKLLNLRKLETLKERWWNQNPKKRVCDNSGDDTGGISIYNIGGVFIVIFIGIVTAIITLIGEYWYYKFQKKDREVSPEPQNGNKQLSVAEFEKQLQVEKGTEYGVTKTDFGAEYSTNTADIAPVGNPW
jgi:ionotropic glutamate receptor